MLFSSREGHFFLHRIRGILAIKRRACISLRRKDIGELGMRCLSTINRGQHSRQQSHIGHRANLYRSRSEAVLVSPATYIGQPSDQYRLSFPPIWVGILSPYSHMGKPCKKTSCYHHSAETLIAHKLSSLSRTINPSQQYGTEDNHTKQRRRDAPLGLRRLSGLSRRS